MTKKTRTRAEAKRLMWEYYRDNKQSLPRWLKKYREVIIQILIGGSTVALCFERVIQFENSNPEYLSPD
jgi:hypothetical protein